MKISGGKLRKKIALFSVIIIAVIAAGGGIFWFLTRDSNIETNLSNLNSPNKITDSKKSATSSKTVIKFAAMGDMLAHDSVIANAKTEAGYDFAPYFADIRSTYRDTDIVFCNQEGLSGGAAFGISGYPSFNAPTEFADGLSRSANCNLINLANNHMGDKGTAAIGATLDQWDRLKPLAFSGANRNIDEQNAIKFFDIKGVRFAFLAFADFNNNQSTPAHAVNLYHSDIFDTQLAEACAKADFVIVSMHWGTEDSPVVNSDQNQQVEKMRRAGVDLVIGTGPHVLQKVEIIDRDDGGKMLVWYSIGNMLSSQLTIDQLTGCIAKMEIVREGDKKPTIQNPTCTPTLMSYDWTVAEMQNQDLTKRHNLRLKPLKDSAADLTRLHFSDTVESRMENVRSVLGEAVEVTS